MMLTGNRPPLRRFNWPADFERFVRKKGYRGIVGFGRFRIKPPRGAETQYQPDGTKINVMGFTSIANIYHRGWLAVKRRTINTVIMCSGFNLLGRGYANEGTDKTKSAGKLLHAKKIETRLRSATAWHVRYLSKDVNDVAHEVTGIVIAPSK